MNAAIFRLVFKPGFLPGWLAILSLAMSCAPQKQFPFKLPDLDRPGKDQIADRFTLRRGYPDTLLLGGFTIVVEKYTKTARWDANLKRFSGLTGYGRVKFSCQNHFFPWGGLWRDAIFQSVTVAVVDSVRNFKTEISVRDAAVLGLPNKAGERVELQLPVFRGKVIDLSDYLNDLYPNKQPEGIRVAFEDLTVQMSAGRSKTGTVLSGVATYPTVPPIPQPPVTLPVAAGFTLEVDTFTITSVGAIAEAKLVLPNSLTAGAECRAATLDLGEILLSQRCEFYRELPDSTFAFGIGRTTMFAVGRGFVADFSSTKTYGPSGKPNPWKGVYLFAGESAGTPAGVISNIGYLQARYTFPNGLVEGDGLWANFECARPYRYRTVQPAGYNLGFESAQLTVQRSGVQSGSLNIVKAVLPKTGVLDKDGNTVILPFASLAVNDQLDLRGGAPFSPEGSLYWGDLVSAQPTLAFGVEQAPARVILSFSAQAKQPFFPITPSGKHFDETVRWDTLQGATFLLSSEYVLAINARNIPATWKPMPPGMSPHLKIQMLGKGTDAWINVATEGVHCKMESDIRQPNNTKLGDPSDPLYVGKTPFSVLFLRDNKPSSIRLRCVESAVFDCDLRGQIDLAEPSKTRLDFKEMVFTSTAQNAGGKVDLGAGGASLAYWGLDLVPKPGFSSSGLVSVRTGQVVLTAAGLKEQRHFAAPFFLTWGELLANGEVGRMFFDYNSAGQKFDGFHFVTTGVALSPFDPAQPAFLRVGGMAHFPFFGGNYLHIRDYYNPAQPADPFNNRKVELSSETLTGFFPTDFSIAGNWAGDKARFAFDIAYDSIAQSGFTGMGPSTLSYLLGGDIASTLAMNERGACIRIGSNLLDQRSLALGPVANISNITRIWGCACIDNDQITNITVGGEVTNAANVSIAARVGSTLMAVLQVTPTTSKLTMDGEAYVSLAAAADLLVNGHIQLSMDYANALLEGEVAGQFRAAEGALLVGNSIEGEGEANWHIGLDYQSIQGMMALQIMDVGGGTGLGAGFYAGFNAPKDEAWVLIGSNPRYNLNMALLPNNLTGVYGYVHYSNSVNLYVVSGGYELFIGFGAFLSPPPILLPTLVGNFGGRIHGEILGGLVSAGAGFNMQLAVGPPCGLGFEGTVSLDACVLWVFCGGVDLTVGLNGCQGFYIE
ncbi:MAG: hypothetical protein JNJ90_05065 [Saprospiraceae bacterium]|nr:hypothetical protein [Saprospiraceae bacterium]